MEGRNSLSGLVMIGRLNLGSAFACHTVTLEGATALAVEGASASIAWASVAEWDEVDMFALVNAASGPSSTALSV